MSPFRYAMFSRCVALLLVLSCAAPLAAQSRPVVTPGITVLVRDSVHLLRGKRVGLITNHTGRDAAGTSSIDLLARTPGVNLVALFGPEHGLRGVAEAGEHVASAVDSATGVTIYSLYGSTQVPTPEMLSKIDVLVYDIQDVGSRTYTYAWTMALSAQAAAKANVPFIVCDRPAMVRGDVVQGNILDTTYRSFIGQYPVPVRYGLTPGELLRHLVRTGQVRAPNVTVVPMQGWQRDMWYDQTGLPWIAPSPNLKTLDAAILYTGTVFVEGTNMSEGRGTDAPFQLVGAPWFNDVSYVANFLRGLQLPGVAFDSVSRTIAKGQKHAGLTIPMLRITITDRNRVEPIRLGIHLLTILKQRHPKDLVWRTEFMAKLAGSAALQPAIERGFPATLMLMQDWERQADRFRQETLVDRLYR